MDIPLSHNYIETPLKLFLFTTDIALAKQAEAAGIDSVIVDWEQNGKSERQKSYLTEINEDTP